MPKKGMVFAWGVFAWVFLRIDRVFLRISAYCLGYLLGRFCGFLRISSRFETAPTLNKNLFLGSREYHSCTDSITVTPISFIGLTLLYNDESPCLLEGGCHQLVKIDTTRDAFS